MPLIFVVSSILPSSITVIKSKERQYLLKNYIIAVLLRGLEGLRGTYVVYISTINEP